jgi:hypothetical protein
MFYGNTVLKQQDTIIENNTIDSIIYNEYLNRCNIFESCTDESDRFIIEAQVEVLYELSIKEVLTKIKNWIKKRLLTIVKGLEKLFSKGKKTKFKDVILKLLNKAKKLLGDVEEAETQEEVEQCKSEFESFYDNYINEIENIADEFKGYIDSYEAGGGDKDLVQIYRQFEADIIGMAKRANEVENEDELDRLEQEINDRQKQHEKNIEDWQTQKIIKGMQDRMKKFSSRFKNDK